MSLHDAQSLRDVLSKSELSRLDKLLVCLAIGERPMAVKGIKLLAIKHGLQSIQKWNVSSILGRATELAVRSDRGWELTTRGRTQAAVTIAGGSTKTESDIAVKLRSYLSLIGEPTTRDFVKEAVSCFVYGLHRSAVVMSWIGAIAVLQDHVCSHHLNAFNEAARRA